MARARLEYIIVWNALFAWDTLATLRLERKMIWQAKWTTMKALFLINRYGSLFWCFSTAVTILTPMSNATCGKVFWIQLVEVVYVLLICHSILGLRLYAIYERNRILKYCLITWLIVEATLAIAAMSYFMPLSLPRPIAAYIGLEGCITTRKPNSPNLVIALNIAPAVFDTSVLGAVAWKNWITTRRIGQQIPILQRLLFDGCFYYVVITSTHLVTAFMYSPMDLPRPVANYIGLEGCLTARKDGSPNLAIALNVSPAVFDTCVLLAVVWKNWITTRRIGQQVPILERLLFDGIVYYIVITATHLATMLMYFCEPHLLSLLVKRSS
ncbi:hypothetical protein JCM16303_001946 [Sporobolomyces ruberrimus]